MRRILVLFACVFALEAHVGSPDVFYEGKAGPYAAMVTIRPPSVIPGVAEVEIRIPADGIREVRVVPMPLTGLGADHPPTPDLAKRDPGDPHFFTSAVWLMAFGSYQVRVDVEGAQGPGRLAVPVPAVASLVTKITPGLSAALLAMMALLSAGMVAILGAIFRESGLAPGAIAGPERIRAGRIAMGAATAAIATMLFFGFRWWGSDEKAYLDHVYKPLQMTARVEGARMSLALSDPGWFRFRKTDDFIPDHGHLMHLFAIRMPGMDRMWHLHPDEQPGGFAVELPDMPAGRYKLFADVVHANGFAETLVTETALPEIHGRSLSGDDADGAAPPLGRGENTVSPLLDSYRMVWERGTERLIARRATRFTFRIEDAAGKPAEDMQLYMGMAGHAEFLSDDATVFAHVHPDGSVPMAALMLTKVPMQHAHGMVPPAVTFPYGFPRPGRYRIFVQIQRNGHPETGVFDARVE